MQIFENTLEQLSKTNATKKYFSVAQKPQNKGLVSDCTCDCCDCNYCDCECDCCDYGSLK